MLMAIINEKKLTMNALSPSVENNDLRLALRPIAAMAMLHKYVSAGLKIGFNIFANSGKKLNATPAPKNTHKYHGI